MATKAKESNIVVKEKKNPSSITSTKKTTTTNPRDKATTSNPTTKEKHVPNYLKPTISSSLVESHSINIPKSDASKKLIINRRRSYDKPPSPSRLPKQKHPSPPYSRQHKALVSPNPRGRSLPLPIKSTNSSKPIPQRLSKTPKEGKIHHQALFVKSDKKSRSPSPSTSITSNKVPKDGSSDSTNGSESNLVETTTEVRNVKTGTEGISEKVEVEEVEKLEKQEEQEVENKAVSEIPPHVEYEHEHGNKHDHDHEVEPYDELHVQAVHDENAIPTVPEEEAAKEEENEDKHDEHENRNQEQCNNINETIPEIKHSTTVEEVEVKEKEKEEEEEEEVYGQIIEEGHKSENNNVEEEKEGFEGGISEEVNNKKEGEDDEEENVEREVKEQVKTEEESTTQPKQQVQHEKKETQVSNDVIEETASMLMEARKNKVRALAGAFQTVIDDQTK
ncbi:hypothetical protein TanjilG_12531 [Lupinus angustifolius]|uniref:Calmodulin-binding domain-containing protein n=1 Tax=Lupinus angustifolius TaxID=3871 RepID=A0A4P1QYI0_LUPAN|nr:PREDICTED: probable inactive protein kinase DDB_G0270444 [Lupinus angustifolius]OIV97774.1 hypothetical protein TanjilG_12531 [Lupinus angustifolius]